MKLKFIVEQLNNKKKFLDKLVDSNLLNLHKLYRKNGYHLRIVGGAVRDILMDKTPKDIDLASDATPTESLKLLKDNNIRVIETGLKHGTITANIDGEDYEITTLRIDKKTDGRHAEVEYTRDWEQDAQRRDLTFNSMSMDFDGNLYDYHGGSDDLSKGVAKFVGAAGERIQEDYLRILRYFRFQGRVNNPTFDKNTLKEIKNNSSGLQQISGERIWSEVKKILSGNHTETILEKMKTTKTLHNIGLVNINVKEFNKIKSNTEDSQLLMAALLPTVDALDTLRERWKFSNSEYNLMKFVITHRDIKLTSNMAKTMISLNGYPREFILKVLEYHGDKNSSKNLMQWESPDFPISGQDLKDIGISPGPKMGKTLNILKRKWVDSDYSLTRNELLNFIQTEV